MFKLFIKTMVLIFLASSPALADRFSRKVPANKSTVVNVVGTYNERSCKYGVLPKVKIVQHAKHGKVVTKTSSFPINKGKCKGKKIRATSIIYTPNRGYRGKDSFKTRFSYDRYSNSGSSKRYVDDYFSILVK